MDYNVACKILNLKSHFTHSELKKNYHIMALQYHPDKNNSENAGEIFRQIVEAYNYLDQFCRNFEDDYKESQQREQVTYARLIADFVNILSTNDVKMVKMFKDDCLEYSVSIIESLDKSILLILANYISIFYRIFNLSRESLEVIITTIKNRLQKTNVYILNPTLENIKRNDIHCLQHGEETIYVPLWHKELLYNDITIKCIPDLPEHIEIDDDNNIHYKVFLDSGKVFEFQTIEVNLCGDIHYIPMQKLFIKKYQKYVIREAGISRINTTNILDIDLCGDIIVHIFITTVRSQD